MVYMVYSLYLRYNVAGPMKRPEPPTYNRINSTGSARTEGYIKIPEAEKSLYLPQRNKAIIPVGSEVARKTSRMNRVNNRRLAADMEVQKKTLSTESDILRFNQLKARKKQLKFARSPIHEWGLFAGIFGAVFVTFTLIWSLRV